VTAVFPNWHEELEARALDYCGNEDVRAVPLVWEELSPGLPDEAFVGKPDLLEFASPSVGRWLRQPELVMKPQSEWPPRVPVARINTASKGEYYRIAGHLYQLGLVGIIAEEEMFQVNGKKVGAGLFGVEKSGTPGPGQRRVTRLIMNMTPSNSYFYTLDDDTATLAASPGWVVLALDQDQALVWNSDDQKGAFFVWKVPRVWQRFMALAEPVPGSAVGRPNEKWVWLCSRVLPMGWLLAVLAYQHVHRQIALRAPPAGAGLRADLEWRADRPRPLPGLRKPDSPTIDSEWWSVYVDDFDAPLVVQFRHLEEHLGKPAPLQQRMREGYVRRGAEISAKKAILGETHVTRMGTTVDGIVGLIKNNEAKDLPLIGLTLWLMTLPWIYRKALQIVMGRWVRVLEFRRPLFSLINAAWQLMERSVTVLTERLSGELLAVCCIMPLAVTNLRATFEGRITASDASETGGGACESVSLRPDGERLMMAGNDPAAWQMQLASRTADFKVEGGPQVKSSSAGSLTSTFLLSLHDSCVSAAPILAVLSQRVSGIASCDSHTLSRRVSRLRWPGLVDLGPARDVTPGMISALKVPYAGASREIIITGRLDMFNQTKETYLQVEDAASCAMRITALIAETFECTPLLYFEIPTDGNTATLDRVTQILGFVHRYLPPQRRPGTGGVRAVWCSWAESLCAAGEAFSLCPENWHLPYGVKNKWYRDSKHLEHALGLYQDYTSVATRDSSSAGAGHRERGDLLCGALLPLEFGYLVGLRLENSGADTLDKAWRARLRQPGSCATFESLRPQFSRAKPYHSPAAAKLVRAYLSIADRGGTDVRLDVGVPYRLKAWPRASISPAWWDWRVCLSFKWRHGSGSHINVLELAAVHATLRWLSRSSSFRSKRVLHLVDSQVCAGVLTRGRSSSRQLQSLLKNIAAVCVATDLYPIYAYVHTALNPADVPSRATWVNHSRKRLKRRLDPEEVPDTDGKGILALELDKPSKETPF